MWNVCQKQVEKTTRAKTGSFRMWNSRQKQVEEEHVQKKEEKKIAIFPHAEHVTNKAGYLRDWECEYLF